MRAASRIKKGIRRYLQSPGPQFGHVQIPDLLPANPGSRGPDHIQRLPALQPVPPLLGLMLAVIGDHRLIPVQLTPPGEIVRHARASTQLAPARSGITSRLTVTGQEE